MFDDRIKLSDSVKETMSKVAGLLYCDALAKEFIGVQPLSAPAGLIFLLRSRYGNEYAHIRAYDRAMEGV